MRKVLIFILLLSVVPAFGQQPPALSAQQILDKMVSVYASCSSYRDTGEEKEVWRGTDRVTTKPFTTAFIRPSQFRYEFHREDIRFGSADYVVWQNGPSVKSWWSVKPGVKLYETLVMAIAGAAGVSGGTAVQVPSMLFGDLSDTHRIQKLSQPTLMKEEIVGGRPAYKIKGTAFRDQEMTIWIDKEKLLLLKTFEINRLPSSQTVEQTTTYKPEINVAIAADKLAFKH